MPRNRDPTHTKKLISIFGGAFSYSVESWSIFFLKNYFYKLTMLPIYYSFQFYVLMISCVYTNTYVSVSICVSCAFACLGVLYYSDLFGLISSYSFYYYFFDACLFSN